MELGRCEPCDLPLNQGAHAKPKPEGKRKIATSANGTRSTTAKKPKRVKSAATTLGGLCLKCDTPEVDTRLLGLFEIRMRTSTSSTIWPPRCLVAHSRPFSVDFLKLGTSEPHLVAWQPTRMRLTKDSLFCQSFSPGLE